MHENYNAKVSDFRASRLISKDEDQLVTLICGHLNPSSFKHDRLEKTLDNQMTSEGDAELIERIGELAVQCSSVKGEERPTVKDKANQLKQLDKVRAAAMDIPQNGEEILHPVPSDAHQMQGKKQLFLCSWCEKEQENSTGIRHQNWKV